MTFDPTITLGAILNAVVLLVGFVVAFTRLGGRIDLLAQRVGGMEVAIQDHRSFDRRLSVVEERMTNLGTMVSTAQADLSSMHRAGQ